MAWPPFYLFAYSLQARRVSGLSGREGFIFPAKISNPFPYFLLRYVFKDRTRFQAMSSPAGKRIAAH
jgi:hypothetical protein